jgi:hypothetical protein
MALGRLAALLLLCSCAQWLLPPLRVLSCSLEEDREGIFFHFSAVPKEESILKAFSMTEDGRRLEGRFVFTGEETQFYPVNGIGEGRTYTVSLSTAAEDQQGNSLEEDYHREFFTGAEGEAPHIVLVLPADGSVLAEAPEEIRLCFSEAVDPLSFEEALGINPSPSYVIRWEGDREVFIRPVKPMDMGKRYTITISTALLDRSRNSMVLPFSSSFFLGNDRSAPEPGLKWINAAAEAPLVRDRLNTGLPPDAEFIINFSRDVAIESLGAYIETRPSLGLSINAEGDSRSRARISLTRQPAWGENYTLIVRRGIGAEGSWETAEDLFFPLAFDAPQFRPPEFLGGFFDIKNKIKNLSEKTDFDSLSLDPVIFRPVTGGIEATELCLVFAVSPEAASISPSSAMEAFSISASNGCAYISIKKLRILDEASYRSSSFNDGSLEGGGKRLCALVYGLEIENTQQQGLIIFSIRSTLEDLLGNSLGRDINITWNKE